MICTLTLTAVWGVLCFCVSVLVFSKSELYDMCWDLKDGLRDGLVAAAPYGGPIGMHNVLQESVVEIEYPLLITFLLSPFSPPQLSSGNLSNVLQVLVLSWRFILHLDLPSPASL